METTDPDAKDTRSEDDHPLHPVLEFSRRGLVVIHVGVLDVDVSLNHRTALGERANDGYLLRGRWFRERGEDRWLRPYIVVVLLNVCDGVVRGGRGGDVRRDPQTYVSVNPRRKRLPLSASSLNGPMYIERGEVIAQRTHPRMILAFERFARKASTCWLNPA